MKHISLKNKKMLGLVTVLVLLSWQSRAQDSSDRNLEPHTSGLNPATTKSQANVPRKSAYWNNEPPLKRGIGQRFRDRELLPADDNYLKFIGSTVRYPREAASMKTGGIVKILVLVNPAGEVANTELIESTIPVGKGGGKALIQEAHRVLRQLRFEPAAQATEEELSLPFVAL